MKPVPAGENSPATPAVFEKELQRLYGPNAVVVAAESPESRETIKAFARLLPEMNAAKRQRLSEERISALLDAMLPEDPIRHARRDLEIANAKLRAAFIADHDCYTSAEVSEIAGHDAKNRSVTASRWKAEGRIFSVPFRRSELYPAFQFREGLPHPAIAAVLAALPRRMTGWQRAFWFITPNGWLGGARPADSLHDEAAAVAAAVQESAPIG